MRKIGALTLVSKCVVYISSVTWSRLASTPRAALTSVNSANGVIEEGGGGVLVDEDLDLSSLAYLQSGVDELPQLWEFSQVGLAENGLASCGLDVVNDFLSAPPAVGAGVADDNIGASFGELHSDTSANASISG